MNLFNLLKSGAFQGAATLLGLLLGLLPFLRARTKRLAYQVVRNADVFSPGQSAAAPHYDITVNGHVVTGLALVVLTLRNTGRLPIRKADFDDPLEFRFPGETTVLSSRLLSTAPATLTVTLSHTASAVQLAPLLLKHHESVSLEVLLSHRPDHVVPVDRMPEVKLQEIGKDIDPSTRLYYWTAAATWGYALFLWGLFTTGYTLARANHQPYSLRQTLPFLVSMSLIPLVSAFFLLRRS